MGGACATAANRKMVAPASVNDPRHQTNRSDGKGATKGPTHLREEIRPPSPTVPRLQPPEAPGDEGDSNSANVSSERRGSLLLDWLSHGSSESSGLTRSPSFLKWGHREKEASTHDEQKNASVKLKRKLIRSMRSRSSSSSDTQRRLAIVDQSRRWASAKGVRGESKEASFKAEATETDTVVKTTCEETGKKKINQYIVIKSLGSGASGKVKLCEDGETGQLVAIKIIRRRVNSRPSLGGRRARLGLSGGALQEESLLREVAVMKKVVHPHAVRLYEVIDDPNAQKLYMVMEYVSGGCVLSEDSYEADLQFPVDIVRRWTRDVLLALEFLHSRGFVHGDIKPSNLLCTEEGDIKIADFGCVQLVQNRRGALAIEGDDSCESAVAFGSPGFMAPELYDESASGGAIQVRTSVDVWALGVTIYLLVYGRFPFEPGPPIEFAERVRNDELSFEPVEHPSRMSLSSTFASKVRGTMSTEDEPPSPLVEETDVVELNDFLRRTMCKDYRARIDVNAMLRHPWITNHGSKELCQPPGLTPVDDFLDLTNAEIENAVRTVAKFSVIMNIKTTFRRQLRAARQRLASRLSADDNSGKNDDDSSSLPSSSPQLFEISPSLSKPTRKRSSVACLDAEAEKRHQQPAISEKKGRVKGRSASVSDISEFEDEQETLSTQSETQTSPEVEGLRCVTHRVQTINSNAASSDIVDIPPKPERSRAYTEDSSSGNKTEELSGLKLALNGRNGRSIRDNGKSQSFSGSTGRLESLMAEEGVLDRRLQYCGNRRRSSLMTYRKTDIGKGRRSTSGTSSLSHVVQSGGLSQSGCTSDNDDESLSSDGQSDDIGSDSEVAVTLEDDGVQELQCLKARNAEIRSSLSSNVNGKGGGEAEKGQCDVEDRVSLTRSFAMLCGAESNVDIGVKCAASASFGGCNEMEDRHVIALRSQTPSLLSASATTNCNSKESGMPINLDSDHCQRSSSGFAGVFDGHNGSECSEFLARHLWNSLANHQCFQTDIARAIVETCARLDSNFLSLGGGECMDRCDPVEYNDSAVNESDAHSGQHFGAFEAARGAFSGSTAVFAVIRKGKLYVANVGDSRATMCSNGEAVDLTVDQKPTNSDESSRIQGAGGWLANGRVNGVLGVARAFGDIEYKTLKESAWEKKFSADLVISDPEVHIHHLHDTDEFMVIGCDGVFDVMSSQQVTNLVAEELNEHGNLQTAADAIIKECNERNSQDNITAVIVRKHAMCDTHRNAH